MMQLLPLPVCMLSAIFASATMVPANTPLTTARTDTSAILYSCYVDYCTWEKYCDHRSQRCENCSNRLSKCFTPAQDANCTAFCMKRRPCPALPQLEHGVHNGSDRLEYWFGDKVTFQCSRGYHNSGQHDTVCQDFGDWSHTNLSALQQPFCQVNLCEFPRAPDHGQFEFPPNTTEFQVGFQIAFGCADGFGPIGGNTTITCLPDGSWDGILPKCVANRCTIPHTPLNGRIVYSKDTTNNSVGTEISYTCKEGYKLIGQTSRRCMSGGKWNEQPPVCVANTCSIPRSPPNGRVDYPDNIINFGAGTRVTYSCNDGYALMGQSSRECLLTRQWSGQPPSCIANTCNIPRNPRNGRVDYPDNITHFGAGTKVTYSCNDGYALMGQSSRECLPTGQWSSQPPSCIVNSCKPPVTPVNGGVMIPADLKGFIAGMEITHICIDGFEMMGEPKQRCLGNGDWGGDVPVCIEKKWYNDIWKVLTITLAIIVFTIFIAAVISLTRKCINHTTTDNLYKKVENEADTIKLCKVSTTKSVPYLTGSSGIVDIKEERKCVQSLRQKDESSPDKVMPPRPAPVTPEISSTTSPDTEQSTPNTSTHIQVVKANTCNYFFGDKNKAIHLETVSANSSDETNSFSSMDSTVETVEETSKGAGKGTEYKPMDCTVSDGGSTHDEKTLIAQETGCAQYDRQTRC